ncbi:hypothetical protein FSP39_008062 [Pinctada imbricata]|uniref:Uncharacterized protein n=1 Tax=Pinctada imbricata TaxID=66713 RepID=A0AA89BT89_PINIB|nr:hypothetical protein FSP39_008062 [Pinctada imbricata]
MYKFSNKKRSYLSTPWTLNTSYCTIPERLRLIGKQNPDKEALIFVGEKHRTSVTYKEVVDGSTIISRKMLKMGIKKKDVVAIHDDKSPNWLFYTFGAQMCGAWPLHFYFQRNDGSDVSAILKESGCKAVISQPGEGDEYVQIMKSFIQFNEDGTVQSDAVPSLKQVLFSRKPEILRYGLTFDDISPSSEKELPEVEPEDVAAIFCSSGSTGPPKLIPWNHHNLINTNVSIIEAAGIKNDESIFCPRTFGWVGGYPRELFIGMPRVTNSTTFKEQNVKDIADATVKIVNQENCKHVVLFSSTVDELLKGNYRMKPVETIMSSGGPMSVKDPKVLERLCKKFINLYGSTESGALAMKIFTIKEGMRNNEAGLPLHGIDIKVVNKEDRLCEVGNVGEVNVRNRSSSTGYLHEEQDWHKSCRIEGYWFKTGDVGYVSEDGHLFVTGRISESIIIDGNMVSPSHFEDILMKHPSLEGAVAFGMPDEFLHEVACVAIVIREGMLATTEELLVFYRNEISLNGNDTFIASKFDKLRIIFFDTFPMTSSGKIARKLVKEMSFKILKEGRIKDIDGINF